MDGNVIHAIQDLGDLGLACVLCLIAEQHGIVMVEKDHMDEAAKELASRSSQSLGLATVVIECAYGTDLDHFREGILIDAPEVDEDIFHSPLESMHFNPGDVSLDDRRVADVIIARNLNRADPNVQIQALELIRSKRMYTRSAMHSTGKNFVLIALNELDSAVSMNKHLNDLFAMAHYHAPLGSVDSETSSTHSRFADDNSSMHSIIRKKSNASRSLSTHSVDLGPISIAELREAYQKVTMTSEVSTYLQNIIVTLRLHRYVGKGISALATRHARMISKAMALLHGLDFVTPAIVSLAIRKVYLHRLVLADERTERSLRWGSDPMAVRENMKGVTVESAIDTVLSMVQSPG